MTKVMKSKRKRIHLNLIRLKKIFFKKKWLNIYVRERGEALEREGGCLILRRGGEERLQTFLIMMFVARIVKKSNEWRKQLLGTDVTCIYGISTLSTAFILIDVLIIRLLFAYICLFLSACVKVLFSFFVCISN